MKLTCLKIHSSDFVSLSSNTVERMNTNFRAIPTSLKKLDKLRKLGLCFEWESTDLFVSHYGHLFNEVTELKNIQTLMLSGFDYQECCKDIILQLSHGLPRLEHFYINSELSNFAITKFVRAVRTLKTFWCAENMVGITFDLMKSLAHIRKAQFENGSIEIIVLQFICSDLTSNRKVCKRMFKFSHVIHFWNKNCPTNEMLNIFPGREGRRCVEQVCEGDSARPWGRVSFSRIPLIIQMFRIVGAVRCTHKIEK